MQDSAHDAAEYASDTYDSAKETVKDAAEALSDYFSQYTSWAKKRADETTQASKDVSQVGVCWGIPLHCIATIIDAGTKTFSSC